ncbi:MAG: PorT family protein [Carboxylicivirga sp.]|jgi:hypothetical protein|nr:PorT family protein [Carboxylicivirga sp.]
MLKDRKNIDTVFKDGLSGFEVPPGDYVWESLDKKLNGQKSQRRTILIWRSVAAACIVGLLLLSVQLFYNVSDPYVSQQELAEEQGDLKEKSTVNIVGDNVDQDNSEVINESQVVKNNGHNPINKVTPIVIADNNSASQLPSNISSSDASISSDSWFKFLQSNKTLDLSSDHAIDKQLHVKVEKKYYPLYASSIPPAKSKKAKLSIGGVVSPAYNSKMNNSEGQALQSSNTNISESGINSLGGGLQLRVQTNSRWSFETGILYAQIGQEVSNASGTQRYDKQLNYFNASARVDIANSMGTIVPKGKSGIYSAPLLNADNASYVESTSFSSVNSIKQTLGYIEIPMMARYSLLKQFPYLTVAGGISSNLLVDNSAYVLNGGSKQKIGETSEIKSFVLSSSFGVGVDVPITKTIRINLEPRFKYFLNSVSSSDIYDFQPYSFGVYGGLTFVIN